MLAQVLVASAFAALACAQSPVLGFNHVPNPVTDGQAQAITYYTNDTMTPVTIILRRGVSTDLQTVATLTTDATNGQYVWTPPTSLANGNDYALEIKQGSQINYFGPFIIQGADPSAVASASSMSATAGATAYASSTLFANGTASTTIPVGPATVGTVGSAAGTGTALPRNTTMSRATLTSPSSGAASATAGSPTTNVAATTGAGLQTSSAASASASKAAAAAAAFLPRGEVVTVLLGAAAAAALCL